MGTKGESAESVPWTKVANALSQSSPGFSSRSSSSKRIFGRTALARVLSSVLSNAYNVSMLADPHAVQISVDGSCFPNEKRRSGYAGIVVYPDDPTEIQVAFQGFKESTINRM